MNTDKVIEQAKSWLGITEYDGRFVEIVDTYNEIPGARGPALVSYPWCAIFVSAVYWKAIKESRYAEMACDAMIQKLQTLGVYSAAGTPKAGDIIFYDWDRNGTSDHVGIITEVTANGYKVIEGNKSDAVGYRDISASYPFIKGFGFVTRLDEEKATQPTPSETVGQQMADKVSGTVTLTVHRPVLDMDADKYSADVKLMQTLLIFHKYSCGRCGADGYFGNDTYLALYKMQKDHAKVTGRCDRDSWIYLEGTKQ
jgi:hypothetical protein